MVANRIVVLTLCGVVVITATALFRVSVGRRPSQESRVAASKPETAFIMGQLTDRGQAIDSGALIMASLAMIPNPPPAIQMSRPPKPPIFSAPAESDGTYAIEVNPSNKPYYLRAFYPVMDDAGKTIAHSKAASGILVASPGVKVKQDFSWP